MNTLHKQDLNVLLQSQQFLISLASGFEKLPRIS